jgi:CelD/BcsL family acetyltransferase involved in cellulose biosynthesis
VPKDLPLTRNRPFSRITEVLTPGVAFAFRICYGGPFEAAERKRDLSRLKIKQITWEAFEALEAGSLAWACPFTKPFWLRTVFRHLGASGEPLILAAWDGDHLVGAAPLAVGGDTACFLGNPEVCDYQDLIAVPGCEAALLAALVEHLTALGIRRLVLQSLRPESAALQAVNRLVAEGRLHPRLTPDDVSYEAGLTADWEGYLQLLGGKQRHEVRRKLRRLESGGPVAFQLAETNRAAVPAMETFLDLFGRNRPDKAAFMTPVMSAYFRDLTAALAARRMLRLYILALHGRPAAAVLCFDHLKVRYLYNSAYDERFEELSVGVLCKVFSIQAAIAMGCRRYDFLKGAETYKKRIGGAEVPLMRCEVDLDPN